jgi:hypothetical protein
VRATYLGSLASSNNSGWVGTVGAVFELENRVQGTAWAVPSMLSILLPEFGASFRDGASPGFYARWSMPLRLHLSKNAGVEVRFDATAIERLDDQGVEGMLTLNVGGFIR